MSVVYLGPVEPSEGMAGMAGMAGRSEMSERVEWRKLYAETSPPGRDTLFLDGIAVGDYYRASGDVYRCRFWTPGRLQGGYERLVLNADAARSLLLQLVEGARRESGE